MAFGNFADDGGHDVHDMGVPLDRPELDHGHRAGGAHPSQVVAAQVDEHDVFCALLRVGEQFGSQPGVVLGRGAAGAGAGERVQAGPPAGHGHVRLGRTAHDVVVVKSQQVQVRAGVGAAQHPVDVERGRSSGRFEALAHNDLERLPRPDLLDRGPHCALEAPRFGARRRHRTGVGAGRGSDRAVQKGDGRRRRLGEIGSHRVKPADGLVVGPVDGLPRRGGVPAGRERIGHEQA